jgi:hypothetical protein
VVSTATGLIVVGFMAGAPETAAGPAGGWAGAMLRIFTARATAPIRRPITHLWGSAASPGSRLFRPFEIQASC